MTIIDRISGALTSGQADVVVEPPGSGTGFWAGGPSVINENGVFHLAYRLRRPVDQGRGYANVVARSTDGVHFEPVATVLASTFDCASLERPALIRRPDGGWRLYVSCSKPGSKHWWVEAIDTPAGAGAAELEHGVRTVVLPGSEVSAWKDVVVIRDVVIRDVVIRDVVTRDGPLWRMWACEHLLDKGEDEADRMRSVYLTSKDGLTWTAERVALGPTAGTWDRRGARITSVWESDGKWFASYDGRASAAENWFERTGFAVGATPDEFVPIAGPFEREGRTLRYVTIARTEAGLRLYFETARDDGANDLRTVLVPGE